MYHHSLSEVFHQVFQQRFFSVSCNEVISLFRLLIHSNSWFVTKVIFSFLGLPLPLLTLCLYQVQPFCKQSLTLYECLKHFLLSKTEILWQLLFFLNRHYFFINSFSVQISIFYNCKFQVAITLTKNVRKLKFQGFSFHIGGYHILKFHKNLGLFLCDF